MTTAHDSWLEAPYQVQADSDARYEAALESLTDSEQARILNLTVDQLIIEFGTVRTPLTNILCWPSRAELLTTPAGAATVTRPFTFDLAAVIEQIAIQSATQLLELQDKADSFDPPDSDDHYDLESDADCDYWTHTR